MHYYPAKDKNRLKTFQTVEKETRQKHSSKIFLPESNFDILAFSTGGGEVGIG